MQWLDTKPKYQICRGQEGTWIISKEYSRSTLQCIVCYGPCFSIEKELIDNQPIHIHCRPLCSNCHRKYFMYEICRGQNRTTRFGQ